MPKEPSPVSASTRTVLVDLAAVCVIGAAITAMQAVLVPLCFAAMLAAVLWPPTHELVRRGVPWALALTLVSAGTLLLMTFTVNLLLQSAQGFLVALPSYAEQFEDTYAQALRWLKTHGVDVTTLLEPSIPDPGTLISSLGSLLSGVAAAASSALMVVLIGLFLLVEADGLADKTRRAFGDSETTAHLLGTSASLQSYLVLKTLISALTGVCITALVGLVGLEHAVLWGFVAFLLNYIPNVGSIVAAIPAILLSLITGGIIEASLITAIYLAVNMIVGNWMEPRLMGDSLGLSPLVVLLALLLWGWMWGPAGMLLSVPLTVLLKEIFAANTQTRWIAEFLGPNSASPVPPLGRHNPKKESLVP